MLAKAWNAVLVGSCLAALFAGASAYAVADKDNQGRWNKPTENNAPDKEVPGFLVNLGPTGARAVLTEKTFIVRHIFKDSPAVGRLKLEDVITGVFGKPFSAHHFNGGHGYEGPIMDFGEAIEKVEGKDGKLVLNVTRGSETLEVSIDLEPIGTFSPTFPMNCKKSEVVRAKALKYFVDHPDALNVWQCHARAAVALALLASDDPKHQALGKNMALKWSREKPDAGTWTWDLSYKLITLSEYFLLTKDASVLPAMKTVVSFLEKAQYSGKILAYGPTGDKYLEKLDYAKVDAAQQLYDGGFGHGPYVSGAGKNGYGPMQYTTIFAVTAWQLAGRCGVETNPDSIKRAMAFIHHGTNAAGYVAYGGEFTLNCGLVDPVAWKKSKDGDNYAGRAGASLIAHKLSPEFSESVEYAEKNQRYLQRAYKSLPDGHADANLGIMWGILGAGASGDDKVLRTVLDYHKAFINMMRCHDGSFVLQPGRDYADNGYYMASRYHPTATMALVFGLANPKLLIQGIQVNLPGINPKALKGRMDTAYRALVKRDYASAASALQNPSAEDAAAATAMLDVLATQAQREIAALEALEKAGDIVELQARLQKAQAQFGLLEAFKEKAARFEEGLRQEPWKLELKLAAEYRQLLEALKRNKSAAYAGDLERFGGRYPDSLYGRWAAEVAKEYQASGAIKNPSVVVATEPAGNGSKPLAALAVPAGAASNGTPVAPAAQAAKEVEAKPAAKPGRMAVSTEALGAWKARFVKKLDALAKGGARLKVDVGDHQDYLVRGATEKSLIVSLQGNELPMPWTWLSAEHAAVLAKSAATDDDVEALLIAAVLNLTCSRKEQADELFAKAALKDAEAVKAAKASLLPH